MDSAQESPSASGRLPQVGGVLLPRRRARLITEVFAGVTLAALALPLNIGYAESAGLPVIVGINAAILPVIAFALFSGSRNLVTGPDATIAALLAGVIPALAAETGELPEELALGVAMLTGAILIVLWLLRAGSMVRYISKSVLVGFLAGLGIEILTSQVEKILGIRVDTGEWLTDVGEIITSIPDASAASVLVGVSTIVLLRLGARYTPKLPSPLIALLLVGGAVYVLEPAGVSVLGEIPSGLPELSLPTLGFWNWVDLFGVAVAIAVLSIAEGLAVAGAAARRHDDELDPNVAALPAPASVGGRYLVVARRLYGGMSLIDGWAVDADTGVRAYLLPISDDLGFGPAVAGNESSQQYLVAWEEDSMRLKACTISGEGVVNPACGKLSGRSFSGHAIASGDLSDFLVGFQNRLESGYPVDVFGWLWGYRVFVPLVLRGS